VLAEKFILLLETLKRSGHADGSVCVISTSPHVRMQLPTPNPGASDAIGQ